MLTKALVQKKHRDALETIIGSKEAYRLTVTQKGVLVQYAESYFLLATYASLKRIKGLDIISEDRASSLHVAGISTLRCIEGGVLEYRIHGLDIPIDIPKCIFVFLFLFFFLFFLSSQNKLFNTRVVGFGGNGGVSGVTGRARWQTPTHKSLR